jgi:anti-sigma B factor antagonist
VTLRQEGIQADMRVMAKAATLPYEIRHWETGPKAHVVLASGELDGHAAPSMRETLMALLRLGRTHLVIDMSDATFVDSAMIGVLSGHVRRIRGGVGSLAIVCANENILRTLEVGGIDREVQILASLSEAAVEKVAMMPRVHEHSKLVPAPRTQTLRLRPEASQLALARSFAIAAARRSGLDPRQQYNFALATNEAVANAIRHGLPCPSGYIEIWVEEGSEELTIGVRNGGDFVLPPLPPDPLPEGGRGLRLMSQMVDKIAILQEDAQTVVRLAIAR